MNDFETLAISFPFTASVTEGSNRTVRVTRSDSVGARTVNLSVNDTTEATVSATTSMANGVTQADFVVAAQADGVVDGPDDVVITASQTGYAAPATGTLTVNDGNVATGPTSSPLSAFTRTGPAPAAAYDGTAGANIAGPRGIALVGTGIFDAFSNITTTLEDSDTIACSIARGRRARLVLACR